MTDLDIYTYVLPCVISLPASGLFCPQVVSHSIAIVRAISDPQSLSSQPTPTGDLVIDVYPMLSCHYFLPDPQLPSQPKTTTVSWPLPSYSP